MTILHISDLHGNIGFIDMHAEEIRHADVVVLSGDITNFAGKSKAREVIESIIPHNKNLIGVPGNCDRDGVETYLADANISVHCKCRQISGIAFCGMGGSLPCPGKTPNEHTDEEMASMLSSLPFSEDGVTVCVIHQPPFHTEADIVRSGSHVGSPSVRSFIEKHQPLLCLTGHIHESPTIDTLGKTIIVNPGAARYGRYAAIVIEGGDIHTELREG